MPESDGGLGRCRWSPDGQCTNDATHMVRVKIGQAIIQMPSCDDCMEDDD